MVITDCFIISAAHCNLPHGNRCPGDQRSLRDNRVTGGDQAPVSGGHGGPRPSGVPLASVAEEGKCVVVKREREEECGGPCPLEAKPLASHCTAANNRSYTFTGEDITLVLMFILLEGWILVLVRISLVGLCK